MQLDAFILADAVATPPDGKFYVQGGGLTRMEAPSLPAPIQVAVLVQLSVSEEELHASHKIRLTLIGPTGQPNVAPLELQTMLDPDSVHPLAPGEEQFAVLAVRLAGAAIRAGAYRVELQVDDEIRAARSFAFIVPEGVEQEVDLATAMPAMASPAVGAQATTPKQKRPPPPPKKKARRR